MCVFLFLKGSQLSVERQNHSRLTIVTLVTCALVLFMMTAFVLLYYIKRNDRIRNKLAEITHIKGLSTNYYQVKSIVSFFSLASSMKENVFLQRIYADKECKCNQQVVNHQKFIKFIKHHHHQLVPQQQQHRQVAMLNTTAKVHQHVVQHHPGSYHFFFYHLDFFVEFDRSEEPVAPVNMDIMTGHLILVSSFEYDVFFER